MATSQANGSQTATLSEDTLATVTDAGSFVLGIDASALTLGDEIVVRAKLKVRSVGTTRLAYEATYKNTLAEPVILSIPIASTNELVFTLHQTSGAARAFPWEVWKL